MQVFQNGPNWGRDVFIPLDYVIGGIERVGTGLEDADDARSPPAAASRCRRCRPRCAYAAAPPARMPASESSSASDLQVRRRRGTARRASSPRLSARCRAAADLRGAQARRSSGRDSGIMKLHATERMRTSVDDAMDIHGGKAVIDGPQNYLGTCYRAVPVGITVEGANILTRNLIVFGQGAIRAPSLSARRDERARRRRSRASVSPPSTRRSGSMSVTVSRRCSGPSAEAGPLAPSRWRRTPATLRRSIASSRATPRRSRSAPTWRC